MTGRLWTYVRDGRPWRDKTPPAACYFFSPDRKGQHPKQHLPTFTGVLHSDGYAGFRVLDQPHEAEELPTILEASCWAHARRKFFELTVSNPAPIAEKALRRISELYDIEKTIRGESPDVRKAARQERAKPRIENLRLWARRHSQTPAASIRHFGSDTVRSFTGGIPLSLP